MVPPLNQQEPPAGAATPALPEWVEQRLACPLCRQRLQRQLLAYRCGRCDREFPVRRGIPDFRIRPDPYISIEKEIEKVDRLLGGDERTFVDLVRKYYELSPENPPSLHRHYVGAMDAAVVRGANMLDRLGVPPGAQTGGFALLDIGCGTAGLLAASAGRVRHCVGVDVAFRWLLIGRRRLEEAGVAAPLICANAEWLPFAGGSFDGATADAVLEHVGDPARMRDETLRVLAPGGKFVYTTNNRFSILPEPHVRIPAFGLIPRPLMERVAWTLRRTPYRVRLLSLRELSRLFRGIATITLPVYTRGALGPRHERLRRIWERLERFSLVRAVIRPVAPQFLITGVSPGRPPALR